MTVTHCCSCQAQAVCAHVCVCVCAHMPVCMQGVGHVDRGPESGGGARRLRKSWAERRLVGGSGAIFIIRQSLGHEGGVFSL